MKSSFYINETFFVEPNANSITNTLIGVKSHVEGRLMQVLTILVEKCGEIVTREELITTIWQDYGGGDEGLTQAISLLRKIFSDTQKELIQTVPKKGYILNAVIRYETDEADTQRGNKRLVIHFQKKWALVLFAAILIGSLGIIYLKLDVKTSIDSISTRVSYPDHIKQEELLEENTTNTIVTQAPDSTLYKLVVIGDQPPKFYINNKRIAEGEWEPYMPLINSLKRKLAESKKKTMQ